MPEINDLNNEQTAQDIAQKEQLNQCELMLESGQSVDAEVLEWLPSLRRDLGIDFLDFYDDSTILSYAAENGYLDIVKLLLDEDANINRSGRGGSTPYIVALMYHPKLELIRLFLEYGADVNFHDTPLDALMRYDISYDKAGSTFSDIFNIFYSQGLVDPHSRSWDRLIGEYLPEKGELAILKQLYVDFPTIDLNQTFRNVTMLMFAAENGQLEICRFLIEHGSDPHKLTGSYRYLSDFCFKTSVLYNVSRKGSLPVIEYLLDNGVDVNGSDALGTTPLMRAASHRRKDVIDSLLSYGADVHLRDHWNRNAFWHVDPYSKGPNQDSVDVILDRLHLAEQATPLLR